MFGLSKKMWKASWDFPQQMEGTSRTPGGLVEPTFTTRFNLPHNDNALQCFTAIIVLIQLYLYIRAQFSREFGFGCQGHLGHLHPGGRVSEAVVFVAMDIMLQNSILSEAIYQRQRMLFWKMLKESFVWIPGSLQGSRIRMGMRTAQRWTHKMRVMGWVDSLKTTMMIKLPSIKWGLHGGLIQDYWWLDSVKTTLRIQNEVMRDPINGFEIDWITCFIIIVWYSVL